MNRYERVKEILAAAGAGSDADYGGLGPFWDLPLEQLLNASIYDIRLIAPAQEAPRSCCARPPAGSRSARSGLIVGLRGEAPFDGARFPKLPWAGSTRRSKRCAVFAEWIDDGCPTEGSGQEIGALKVSGPVTIEQQGYSAYDGLPNEYKYQHGELRQRVNLDCMMPSQLEKSALRFSRTVRTEQMAPGRAQLQQSRADSPKPLPARVGALPALAPHLHVRVRKGAARTTAPASLCRIGIGPYRNIRRTRSRTRSKRFSQRHRWNSWRRTTRSSDLPRSIRCGRACSENCS